MTSEELYKVERRQDHLASKFYPSQSTYFSQLWCSEPS